MKTNHKLLTTLVIILLVLFGFWNLKQKNINSPVINERVEQKFKAGLTVTGEKENSVFDISQYVGKTALETTGLVLNGNIKTSGSGQNAFVTEINGRVADNKKREFWEFLVNGKQAEVGAGTYVIQNYDEIVWKISTY